MLEAIRESRQISAMVLDRIGDYLILARIELTIQSREIFLQIAAYVAAMLCSIFTIFFLGLAIIISFWETGYRIVAAWSVVMLCILACAGGLAIARRHSGKPGLRSLREELKRDAELLRENL